MEQPKEYYAFISYKWEDEKWTKWLQHALEYYRLPDHLRQEISALPPNENLINKKMKHIEHHVHIQERWPTYARDLETCR